MTRHKATVGKYTVALQKLISKLYTKIHVTVNISARIPPPTRNKNANEFAIQFNSILLITLAN